MTNDKINARIDRMAVFCKGLKESVTKLQESLLPSLEQADALSAELGAMYSAVELTASDRDLIQQKLLEVYAAKPTLNDDIDAMKAEHFLSVDVQITDAGKLLYSNDKARAAAVTIALHADESYQAILTKMRDLEKSERSYKAIIESYDRAEAQKRAQARALKSRLDNFTARLKGV